MQSLLSAEFLAALHAKAYQYYVRADRRRFAKDVVHSPEWRTIMTIPQDKRFPDPEAVNRAADFFASRLVEAIQKGDSDWIRKLANLLDLFHLSGHRNEEGTRLGVPWHYYVGMAAFELLSFDQISIDANGLPIAKRQIPTKQEVKDRAIAKRERVEGQKLTSMGLIENQEPTERHWARVFSDLGLQGLPTNQGRPAENT